MEWLTEHKVPIGAWAEAGVEWLRANGRAVFDGIAEVLQAGIDGILWALQLLPPLAAVALIAALAYALRRSIPFAAAVAAGLLLIINLGYWEPTTETLALVLSSALICMAVGVPIGILAAHRPWLFTALRPVLDMMQTIPTFVYLIPALILFGLGMVPGLIATIVFAIPAPIRLAQLGIASTPAALREAADAFGATSWQKLWKVELPYALPQIMEGLTQTIMLSLSMVVIAALVGADGLGKPVQRALGNVNIGMGFESGLVIVLVAIILDRLLRAGEHRRDPS
jgi:glycine betaine/proline transport system permease protein